jgi:acyl-CoA thioester hydrolase
MFISETKIRVRYAETDRMGFVYYGHYAAYFEVARVEALRSLGFSYREMEDDGILLPVLDFKIRYRKPAKYDDVLTIRTSIPELPSFRISFNYVTMNEEDLLLNEAETTLVFVKQESMKPMPAPEGLINRLLQYY